MTFLAFQKFCRENKLQVFEMSDLKILFDQYSPEYLRLKLARWKAKGYLSTPKRGLYVLEGLALDEFEIAAKLITPSYISLESALSHYSIIPDVSAEVSSITTKNTRRFRIGSSLFQFYHIKQGLFFGFSHMRNGVFIAVPEKAVLDFLYFRKPDDNHMFFERINRENTKRLNMKIMEKMAQKFPSHIQKMYNFFKHVIA